MGFYDDLFDKREAVRTVNGVMRGVVKENWNEKQKGRVKVEFFMGEPGKKVSDWIPVMMPYTGNKAGLYLFPEVGTEVVVAFEMGNPDCPVVIGSLWNNNCPMPQNAAVEKNTVKCLRTKGGHEITFDEEKDKGVFQVKTPGEMTVKIEDETQKVVVQNKKGDTVITLDGKDGTISLDGQKKLELKVGGKALITLESDKVDIGAGTVSVEGKQSLKMRGQSVNLKGNMLELKADASLKAESGAVAEIKGAMVKLN